MADKILFGGDYNPEQWDDDIRRKDMELLPKAGIDIVTLNVFSWTQLQPNEDTYDFTELDSIVDMVTSKNMKICMATSTAAHPAWMARRYPDILRVDEYGRKRKYGGRHNSCPNSPAFRKYSPLLAGKLAEHFKENGNIVLWHISNEYGGACYCENCEKAFRKWLRKKYGSLDELNYAWNNNFWSHKIQDWDEIVAPTFLTERCEGGRSSQPGLAIDYMRFNSDSMLQNFMDERDAIKSVIPDARITTNFMEMFKGLDYQKWAREMDIVSWDSYPQQDTEPAYVAFNHDIMRGLKHGQPFVLMESTPSMTSWRNVNTIRRPGDMRRWSYQAVAHGADAVMFFQMRKSPGAGEMFHGAVIAHSGREDTRTFREVSQLGAELKIAGDMTLSAKSPAKAAIIFDWDCWWALEEAAGISYNLKYPEEALNYYRAFYEWNIPVDVISVEDPLESYGLIVAPCMFMLKDGIDEKLKDFAAKGGAVILTTMSGIVTEDNRAILGGFPGKLLDFAGLWVEETSMLGADSPNSFTFRGETYSSDILCDVIRSEGAKSVCTFEKDYFAGYPVITRNSYKGGQVYYVGTTSTHDFYRRFIGEVCQITGIPDVHGNAVDPLKSGNGSGLEITKRINQKGTVFFVINHRRIPLKYTIQKDSADLLTGELFHEGEEITVGPNAVYILKVKY